jgi:hypothetical protein
MARSLQKIAFCSIVFLAACSHGAVMTRSDYENVTLGTPVSEIIQEYGDPVSIKENSDGSKDYRYVERIMMGEQTIQQNNYTLVMKNGQVVSKHSSRKTPNAYDEIYEEDPNAIPELN